MLIIQQQHHKFMQNSVTDSDKPLAYVPQHSTEKPNLLIKDNNYFLNTQNLWNNPFQAQKKAFLEIHEQNQKASKIIRKKEQEQKLYDQKMEEKKRELLASEREYDLDRLSSRKQERVSIQQQCGQIKENQAQHIDSQKYSITDSIQAGRAQVSWNKLNGQSRKSIRTLITPTVLKMDEQAVRNIQGRIQSDQETVQLQQDLKIQNRQVIRQKFISKHEENFNFEKKCGLVPNLESQVCIGQKNGEFLDVGRVQNNSNNDQSRGVSSFQLQRPTRFSQKFISQESLMFEQAKKSSPNIIQLSNPKQFKPVKNSLDRTEFKGLYLAEVDFLSSDFDSTEFTRTVVNGSTFLRQTLQTQKSRPSTKQTSSSSSKQIRSIAVRTPKTLTSNYFDMKNDLAIDDLKEIEQFQASIRSSERRVGFPGITLNTKYGGQIS